MEKGKFRRRGNACGTARKTAGRFAVFKGILYNLIIFMVLILLLVRFQFLLLIRFLVCLACHLA